MRASHLLYHSPYLSNSFPIEVPQVQILKIPSGSVFVICPPLTQAGKPVCAEGALSVFFSRLNRSFGKATQIHHFLYQIT